MVDARRNADLYRPAFADGPGAAAFPARRADQFSAAAAAGARRGVRHVAERRLAAHLYLSGAVAVLTGFRGRTGGASAAFAFRTGFRTFHRDIAFASECGFLERDCDGSFDTAAALWGVGIGPAGRRTESAAEETAEYVAQIAKINVKPLTVKSAPAEISNLTISALPFAPTA